MLTCGQYDGRKGGPITAKSLGNLLDNFIKCCISSNEADGSFQVDDERWI